VHLFSVLGAAFALTSPAFAAGHTIPKRYTCDGANVSPALRWTAPPRRTRSFALLLDDPDAPSGTFTHWLAWNIKPSARRLAVGARPPRQGRTSAGGVGYTGPCPPSGPAHRYAFKLYALRKPLPLRPGADRAAFDRALRGRVLRVTRLVGRYGR
jgi:Raf kinase inhibitor-like YbhB/YbcL family protein